MPRVLPIKGLEEKKSRAEKKALASLDPILPKPPFTWLLLAQSGSGKTVALANMLMRSKFYRDYFDRDGAFVCIMSPTLHNDPVCGLFKQWRDAVCLDDYDPRVLEVFMAERAAMREAGEEIPPALFIFDDLADTIRDKTFESFVKKNRHFNASIWCSSQTVVGHGPSARKNAHVVSIWPLKPEDLQAAAKAYAPRGKDTFWRLLREATGYTEDDEEMTPERLRELESKKYDFLTLVIKGDNPRRALACFDREIGRW